MRACQGAASAAGAERRAPARDAWIHRPAASVLAHARSKKSWINLLTTQVVAKAQRTGAAAGVELPAVARQPRSHRPAAALPAEAWRDDSTLLLEGIQIVGRGAIPIFVPGGSYAVPPSAELCVGSCSQQCSAKSIVQGFAGGRDPDANGQIHERVVPHLPDKERLQTGLWQVLSEGADQVQSIPHGLLTIRQCDAGGQRIHMQHFHEDCLGRVTKGKCCHHDPLRDDNPNHVGDGHVQSKLLREWICAGARYHHCSEIGVAIYKAHEGGHKLHHEAAEIQLANDGVIPNIDYQLSRLIHDEQGQEDHVRLPKEPVVT
mmetsp:Transcript_15533/g.35280  ORF Transcript_15533/g.35280 Transcript_15533/m.35280 type:complete len:318 (+) Transcript_15533:124-1077(+)